MNKKIFELIPIYYLIFILNDKLLLSKNNKIQLTLCISINMN